jgi:hypothetical protein
VGRFGAVTPKRPAFTAPATRIPEYARGMVETTRITVTLPSEHVAALRRLTDNISGYVAEAVARQIRHQLLGDDLQRYQDEHGVFTEEELAEAKTRIFGAADSKGTSGSP